MTTAERLTIHDKQIAAIRVLVREGMMLVVETRKNMRLMLQSQKRTEKSLADLIAALGRGANGKHRAARNLARPSWRRDRLMCSSTLRAGHARPLQSSL